MGVNKLNSLMKECAAAAGIGENKRITNDTVALKHWHKHCWTTTFRQRKSFKLRATKTSSLWIIMVLWERDNKKTFLRFCRLRLPLVQPSPWSLVKLASFLQLRARQQPAWTPLRAHLISCLPCFLAIILLEEHLMFVCLPPRRLHPAHWLRKVPNAKNTAGFGFWTVTAVKAVIVRSRQDRAEKTKHLLIHWYLIVWEHFNHLSCLLYFEQDTGHF